MPKRSEGVRRLTKVISAVLILGWLFMTVTESPPLPEWGGPDLFVFCAGVILGWFIPVWVRKTVYWIRDGFEDDEKDKE